MIDIILIVLFLAALLSGYRKGLILQLVNLVTLIVAFVVAYIYFKPLAEKFLLWVPYPAITENTVLKYATDTLDISMSFYQLLAFAVIFFLVKIALSIFTSIFDFLKHVPVLGIFNSFFGAILGFIQGYFMIFILLYVLALLPIESIQKYIESSILTKLILEYTPIISKYLQSIWFVYTN
ncbi:CvpA family protein [Kurthia sibirica]|uniref:CvpA family protein n=1 Tax=Kurthia sibirica TaxID=202750 RepID=A0A2U3ANP9_9BACL|nr:CvpA family protein [Kurthia sibirica]PWI26151.1 hypothetical protein DEX24_04290 [Kurthia sibirica]GEK33408.1 membrane protein [Kurthia sibirica]